MIFQPQDFIPLSPDAQRTVANLEQAYAAWLDTQRELADLPSSMFWAEKNGTEYLHIKHDSRDAGTTVGARNTATQTRYDEYTSLRSELQQRDASLSAMLAERGKLYRVRTLRLPTIADAPVKILRQLDIEELLGIDVIVVGTTAFAAYELAAGVRFPTGNEVTEDFDMAWCKGTQASLAMTAPRTRKAAHKTVFSALRAVDRSYKINRSKPYQAVNAAGYEVELLAAPSTHPLPKDEAFDPMASLVEQEWLLMGAPLSAVVASEKGSACPLVAPDPRWMALHKLWLADKPERKASKKDKDRRQGHVLLDAVRHFMQSSHPLNIDFVLDLPAELQTVFNAWAAERQFVPAP
jgi:hypothetical protein